MLICSLNFLTTLNRVVFFFYTKLSFCLNFMCLFCALFFCVYFLFLLPFCGLIGQAASVRPPSFVLRLSSCVLRPSSPVKIKKRFFLKSPFPCGSRAVEKVVMWEIFNFPYFHVFHQPYLSPVLRPSSPVIP